MLKKVSSSWRTTFFGLLYSAFVLIGEAYMEFDKNPDTKINWTHVGEALTVLGIGFSARDNNVSSEQAGVK